MSQYSTSVGVNLDTSTLERGQLGSITGTISLRLGSRYFPEQRWNDFPVVLANWWIEALDAIRGGKAAEVECRFMEGPYLFVVRPGRSGWHLRALAAETTLHVEVIDPTALWESVVSAGRGLVAECQARNWSNRDVVALSQALQRTASTGAA